MSRASIGGFLAIAATASAQPRLQLAWSRAVNLNVPTYATALAVTPSGDVYFGGVYDNPSLQSFIARYDAAGNQNWLRTSQAPIIQSFVLGLSGEILATGNAGSLLWMGRYNHDGVLVGQGTGSVGNGHGAAPDGTGGAFVVGPTGAGPDVVVARFLLSGQQQWSQVFGGPLADLASAAAPDGSGGVYVAAHTLEGSLGGPPAGHFDVVLDRYDSAGNRVWIRRFGSSGADEANAAAASPYGCFVAGRTSAALGGPSAGYLDGFVALYNDSGVQQWVRQFGTASYEEVWCAAPDGSGGVWLGGITGGALGGPSGGSGDGFIVRFNGEGEHSGFFQFGVAGSEWPQEIWPDGAGGVYLGSHEQIGGVSRAVLSRFICYANCDTSTTAPQVNVADFTCFLQRFAAGGSYANCDGSTTPPTLNVADFSCFLQAFAAGCP